MSDEHALHDCPTCGALTASAFRCLPCVRRDTPRRPPNPSCYLVDPATPRQGDRRRLLTAVVVLALAAAWMALAPRA